MSDTPALRAAWIERILGLRVPDSPGTAPARTEGAAVRVAKGLLAWNAARAHVGQQVKTLQQAILQQTQDEPDFPQIEQNLGKLEAVLEVLDDRMTEQLNALRGTSDPAAKQTLSAATRQLVADYQAEVEQNGLLREIDDNGFVPTDIKKTVMSTLAAMKAAI